jgi:hypothetical protein
VVPLDAAVLNFVVTYFEHCDNNARADFKVGGLPAGRAGGRACVWVGGWVLECVGGFLLGWVREGVSSAGCATADACCCTPNRLTQAAACPPVCRLSLQVLIDLPGTATSLESWANSMQPLVGDGCLLPAAVCHAGCLTVAHKAALMLSRSLWQPVSASALHVANPPPCICPAACCALPCHTCPARALCS